MKKSLPHLAVMLSAACLFAASCKKEKSSQNVSNTNVSTTSDTAGTIKATAASLFPNFGLAVTYGNMANVAAYLGTVKREATFVTFGNELKEGSVVKSDGTYDYTTADALYNLCATNNLQVYGHTLVWYAQQNATYLNGLISALVKPGPGATPAPNLLNNLDGDFETGSGNSFTGWNNLAGNGSVATFTAATGNNSTRAMQVAVTTPGTNAYDVQSLGPTFTVSPGHTINFSIDIKAAAAGGKVRVVVQNQNYLQYDITPTTSWATYTFSLTVGEASPSIRLNFPVAGTYTIDNIIIQDPSQANLGTGAVQPTASQMATAIDAEMRRYIQTTMTHYAGKIKAWDVVNEPLLDNGQVRTDANYTIPTANTSNQFLYAQYLGGHRETDNYMLRAFKYARQTAPDALLFVNDYNLEYSRAKIDSMVTLVKDLNANGATIDGVGTQMHVNLNTSLSGIDYAFQALASTGLKVRISELDIALNVSRSSSYVATTADLNAQQAMYKYIISSYIKNVPSAQRYGVTVWGVTDTDSWINTTLTPDAPLLFDKNYQKKPAYAGFMEGLKGQ